MRWLTIAQPLQVLQLHPLQFLGGDGDALMFMLPDGTSATAEEYMDRLDRDTGREQL